MVKIHRQYKYQDRLCHIKVRKVKAVRLRSNSQFADYRSDFNQLSWNVDTNLTEYVCLALLYNQYK